MEMSPKAIAAVTFPVVRKGYDPEQVRSFLSQLSRGVEELQNRALQAEAKARLTTAGPAAAPEASMESVTKVLAQAQRTADATVAEARDEAEGIRRQASERAESILAEAKAHGAQVVTAAEQEALRTGEVTRGRVAAEVDALEAQRAALSTDVESLTAHVVAQRERLASTVAILTQALESPEGLQPVPPPALAAPPDEPAGPALVASEAVQTSEPAPTEAVPVTDTRAQASAFPAPAPSAPGGPPAAQDPLGQDPVFQDPVTEEVPMVGQGEPQAWGFFDEEPKGDDRWKR